MTLYFTSCLALLTALFVVRASGTSPMEKSFRDVIRSSQKHSRQTRSVLADLDCVSLYYLTELKGRFTRMLDHNDDGRATFEEVREFLKRIKPNVTSEFINAFIARRDTNGDGEIEFVPEYVSEMSKDDYTMEGANEWFYLHDKDGDGFLTQDELMATALAIGLSPEDAVSTVRFYYMPVDQDGDSKLSFDEFKRLFGQ